MAWRVLLVFILAAATILLLDPFPTTDERLAIDREGDILVLGWEEPIRPPMAKAIRTAIRRDGKDAGRILLVLNSPGGSVDEGAEVMAVLKRTTKRQEVTTYVPEGAICASMCVPIYLEGSVRAAAPGAEFMFHDAYSVDNVTGEVVNDGSAVSAAMNASVFHRFLRRSALDTDFLKEIESDIASEGEAWRTGRELHRNGSGAVTKVSGEAPL